MNPNSAAARRRNAAQTTATDQKVKNGAFDQPFSNFQFARQNSSSEVETAFSGADDPFQIGEGMYVKCNP